MNEREIVQRALDRLDTDDGKRDPGLSVYMVRDLEVTKAMQLRDLAWAYHRAGSCTHKEAVWVCQQLQLQLDLLDDMQREDMQREEERRAYNALYDEENADANN